MATSISRIRETHTFHRSREAVRLSKRMEILQQVLESLDEKLALLPKADRDALRSMYYEAVIDVTFSHYLFAEELIAVKTIRQSSSTEEDEATTENLRKRITALAILCDESA